MGCGNGINLYRFALLILVCIALQILQIDHVYVAKPTVWILLILVCIAFQTLQCIPIQIGHVYVTKPTVLIPFLIKQDLYFLSRPAGLGGVGTRVVCWGTILQDFQGQSKDFQSLVNVKISKVLSMNHSARFSRSI